jgi:beta-glucosidase
MARDRGREDDPDGATPDDDGDPVTDATDGTERGGEGQGGIAARVAAMSLEEKVAQLGTVRIGALLEDGEFDPDRAAAAIGDGIGRVTRVGRETDLDPDELARAIAAIQSYLRTETGPGVPAHVREEGLCGYAGRGGTPFPQRLGLAATWNPALVRAVDRSIAAQLAAVGCTVTLSPVADLGVEPRWGRTEETYGEDPLLAARLAVASVRGLQGTGPLGVDRGLEAITADPAAATAASDDGTDPDPDPTGPDARDGADDGGAVLATPKHFAAHGRPAGGRNRAAVSASRRTLRNADLLPFRAAVTAGGAGSVMAAYHAVDGVPCHASEWLLTEILREEWGFDGTVVSDGRGIDTLVDPHGVAATRREAGVQAIRAGVDVELPETACFGDRLVAAVRDGELPEPVVDRAVRRHLRGKRRAGLLEGATRGVDSAGGPPAADEAALTAAFDDRSRARALARAAARQSITLLANDGLLPLSGTTRGSRDGGGSVAVVGPNADSPRNLLGNYAYGGGLGAPSMDAVTPLDGLRDRFGADTVVHERGCAVRPRPDDGTTIDEAARCAAAADVAVVCVGGQSGIDVEVDSRGTAGEALDRAELALPGGQPALVEAVAATGTPTVVVLINGRPLAVPDVVAAADATLEAWLPGVEGGRALADVLLGDADPGGRLPVSLPRSVGHLPVHYRQPRGSFGPYVFEEAGPLFPFGHGESYATFRYGDLQVSPATVAPDEPVTVEVTVENVADRAGEDVVQAYTTDPLASRVRPERQLVGFRRLAIAAGETATVRFRLAPDLFGYVDRAGRRVVEPGEVDVAVGRSVADLRARASVSVEGATRRTESSALFAETTVSRADDDE